MTLIALILHYFTEFDSFAGRLRPSGSRWTYSVRKISSYNYIWPKL